MDKSILTQEIKIVYIKLISLSGKKVYVYDKFMTIKKTNLLISLDIF